MDEDEVAGEASRMTAAFAAEVQALGRQMALTGREMDTLGRGVGQSLRRVFDGVVFDGMRLGDALRTVLRSVLDGVYGQALRPVQAALGGAVARGVGAMMGAFLPFARGGSFAQGRVVPFAQGGVVTAPTLFPMRGGATGLMGEAGPEAIMPLARGADGRLGVRAAGGGGGGVQVSILVQTPDVEGFRRSEAQIAAEVGRLLDRGARYR